MTLRIVLVGAAIALGSATLLAQEEQPQITPRPKPQAGVVGPNAVTQASPASKPASAPAKAAASTSAQDTPQLIVQNPPAAASASVDVPELVTVPAGTKIPLTLKQGINTKNAHIGDPVYAQTAFPITQNDEIVIPAGTFVRGEIQRVQRPGHVKGRAELLMSFNSLIYPNGYTVILPGAVHGTPGSPDNDVKGQEGTIQGRQPQRSRTSAKLQPSQFRAPPLEPSPAREKEQPLEPGRAPQSAWPQCSSRAGPRFN